MPSLLSVIVYATTWSLAAAHTVITYPGWRGDNLWSNGTTEDGVIPDGALGINYVNGTPTYPYGMQWMYPCGGMPTSRNRTKWPINGGAIAIQPGWFSGHATAFFYINMGYGNEPLNMSHPMVPVFQITGPANTMYKGAFCLPQVPLPANASFKVGDNATIQVVETAVHGAALYNCVDITFAEPEDVAEVNETNCQNTTEPDQLIGFNLVFTTKSLESGAPISLYVNSYLAILPTAAALFWAALSL